MATEQTRIQQLTEPMLKKKLFVVISRVVASQEEIEPHIVHHLEYMNGLEEKGLLFASGPFPQPGIQVGDGLTILATETLEEAEELIKNEPTVKLGFRTYELRPWELREGRFSITLNMSVSRFSL